MLVGCAGGWSWFRDLRLGGILARATESIAIAALAWPPGLGWLACADAGS